jgi:hypothetical protein
VRQADFNRELQRLEGLSRRSFVLGLARLTLVGAGGSILAACGVAAATDGEETTSSSQSSSSSTCPTTTSGSTTSGSATTGSTTTGPTTTTEPTVDPAICASCGTCRSCHVTKLATGEIALECVDCSDQCHAQAMCQQAQGDNDFRQLAIHLAAQGFAVKSGSLNAASVTKDGSVVREVLEVPYEKADEPALVASLMRIIDTPTGVSKSAAVIVSGKDVQYGLHINGSGAIEQVLPDPNYVPNIDSGLLPAAAVTEPRRFSALATSNTNFCFWGCGLICLSIANGAPPSMVAALLCAAATAGVGAVLCVILAQAFWRTFTGTLCLALCDTICHSRRLYCHCNKSCYDEIQACQQECKPGLGCFTGICVPWAERCGWTS